MRQRPVIAAFNRGRVSDLGLARVEDVKRIAFSAETMTNFVPRVLGSMMLRVGLEYVSSIRNNNQAIQVPFIRRTTETALIELTANAMRVRIADVLLTRPSVASAVTNGSFSGSVAGWTNADEAGATSAYAAGDYLSLVGTGTNAAIRTQQVVVGAADQNVEHALRINIQRGPVTLRVGSTSGGDDYISETSLGTGAHSLSFTPTGNFWIHLSNRRVPASLVADVNVESSGVVELTTPWAAADLQNIRAGRETQSVDVLFVSCKDFQQRRIERRSARSWSIVLYEPEDGPFRIENTGPITVTPSALTGDITIASSAPLFYASHAPGTNNGGALWRISSEGQTVTASITAQNTFTNAIRVTGVGSSRDYAITVSGISGTGSEATLQRSFDSDTGPWSDVPGKTWTADTAEGFNDTLDNQITWYRIGVKTGDYVAGTIVPTLVYGQGSITGVVRITGFTNSQSVSARVLADLGGTAATDQWAEGLWSDVRGWPSAGCFYEGRFWGAGIGRIVGSVSDAFDSFDPNTEGDSGPINRAIGSGPNDDIPWILPLQRLLLGTEGAEISVRPSSLDEPLTPTAFNQKEASTEGSALVGAVKIDSRAIFVHRNGTRVYELKFDPTLETGDYAPTDLTQLIPEIGEPSIIKVAVQRKPDTRLHCVRSDGTVALAVIDKVENVLAWLDIETDGDIEDAAVLPGSIEDRVYYTVKRTLASGTVRYLEKWALESECQSGTLNKQLDSFYVFSSGTPTLTISGLDHLEGEDVAVWADGTDRSPGDEDDQTLYTVTGGIINVTVGDAFTSAVVGLPYKSRWKNAKLALAMALGSSLTQTRSISQLGIIAKNLHPKGLRYGRDFDHLDDLPQVKEGAPVDPDVVHATYDVQPFNFNGPWSTDSRVCLQAHAPRPCTILACVMNVEHSG